MSTNSLNGVVGQPARFGGDYLFRGTALPNNTAIESEGYTLNNTLGQLMLVGEIDAPLPMAAANTLTVALQYQDGKTWKNHKTLLSLSGEGTIPAGRLFDHIPTPSDIRRKQRLLITSNFNASAAKITAAIEILPSV
jgi:hypothetical protein